MRKNNLLNTREIEALARREELSPAEFRAGLESGRITVVRNRGGRPLAIGAGCYVKVNANIGTSPSRPEVKEELEKLRAVEAAGADA
ncbi:MAG TPA: phosphomethylpyrimidine synthase ThiC, partial [bacterium]|nr:phosphomethylpyrimidine synthase ThiC [bacterium]